MITNHTHRNLSRRGFRPLLTNRVLPLPPAPFTEVRRCAEVSADSEFGLATHEPVKRTAGWWWALQSVMGGRAWPPADDSLNGADRRHEAVSLTGTVSMKSCCFVSSNACLILADGLCSPASGGEV